MPESPQLSPGDQDRGSACRPPGGPECVCVCPPAWCPAGARWVLAGHRRECGRARGAGRAGPVQMRRLPAQAVVLRGPCCTPRLPQPRPRPGGDSLLPAAWLPTLDRRPVWSLDLQPGSASRGPCGGRRLWACWFLLDSHADMLLDLSDLLQVDEPPRPSPAQAPPAPAGRVHRRRTRRAWVSVWKLANGMGRGWWRPRGWL